MEEEQVLSSDMEEVREQLEQQRVLAAQLREKLHQDEQQLASKELQNERLKSRLSLIKSRSRTKRGPALSEKDDQSSKKNQELVEGSTIRTDSETGGKRTPSKANKGKINILREQLEQNRLRFERHGQELTEDARSMEAMVEQLRHELEERDVTIQQLQAGQIPPVPVSVEEPVIEPLDLGAQLVQKEAQLMELMNKASELQNTVLELQENLREKDCVIEARTQAITLLSEDMSKKWRANVDMLEETRQQMHIMQENFIGIEAGLNAEIEKLNQHLDSKSKKIAQLDQSFRDSEAVRLDLAARNDELQDKITKLQDHQAGPGEKDMQAKIDELTQALSEANKVAVKLKAEHKAKIKMLNKQVDSLRKESGATEEIVRLQNHIAELEEDKGNLQLHLIEMEEQTGNQEQQLMELQSRVSELQDLKIAAEMKVVELEEQLSSGNLELVITELKMKLDDRDSEIKSLHDKLNEMQGQEKGEQEILLSELKHELKLANGAVAEWQMRCESLEAELTKQKQEVEFSMQSHKSANLDFASTKSNSDECDSGNADSKLKEDQEELKVLASRLQEYENVLVPKLEYLESAFKEKVLEVKELESLLHLNVHKIDALSDNKTGQEKSEAIEDEKNLQNLMAQQEEQLAQLLSMQDESERVLKDHYELQTQLTALVQERDNIREHLNDVQERCNKMEAANQDRDVTDLQRELIEVSGQLDLKREECVRLETKLKAQTEKYKKMAVNLKVKTVSNKDLEERVGKFESILASSRAQYEQLSKEKQDSCEKWQMEISEKESLLHEITDKLCLKDVEIESLQKELSEKTAVIHDLNITLTTTKEQVHNLQQLLDDTSSHMPDRNLEIEKKLAELQSQLASEIEDKSAALSRLETVTKSAKIKLAKEKKMRLELEQKLEELEKLQGEKTVTVSEMSHQLQKEIEKLKEEKLSIKSELDKMKTSAESLKQNLESEKTCLHFASENLITAEQRIELTQEFNVDVMEQIQAEIENLRSSWTKNECTVQQILENLNDEGSKSLEDLRSSFDTVHKMISNSMSGKPDLEAELRAFNELKSLVTKVTQRTAALGAEVRRIIAEKEELVKRSTVDYEKRIEELEEIIQGAKEQLAAVLREKEIIQEHLTEHQNEYFNLEQTLLGEKQKVTFVEEKLEQQYQELLEIQQKLNLEEQNREELNFKLHFSEEKLEEERQKASTLEQQLEYAMHRSQEELEGVNHRVLDFEQQLTLSKLEQDTLQEELDGMRYQAEEREQKCFSLQGDMNEMQQNYYRIEQQLEIANQHVLALEQQLQESKEREAEMKHEVLALEEKAQRATELENNLQCQLQDMVQRTSSLEALLEEQKNDMEKENLQNQESYRQRIAELEQELETSVQNISTLESQLTESLQTYNECYNTWAIEKSKAEQQISDLTQQVYSVQQEQENRIGFIPESTQLVSSSNNTNEDSLRQQLAEKTAEIENYQRRLIQLQMGGPDSSSSFFGVVSEPEPSAEVIHLRSKVEELQQLLHSHQAPKNSIMDALQPASSMFEPAVAVSELQEKIANLTQQLDDLHAEADFLRQEQSVLTQLRSDYENLSGELQIAQSEALQTRQTIAELNNKITELTQELTSAHNRIEQSETGGHHTQELNDQMKELHLQLETTQIEKDKAEEERLILKERIVKLQADIKAIQEKESERSEERPCIPQTLDTHVSTLDTDNPLSNMYNNRRKSEVLVHGAMDESLMERNINQLESELSGMVTSQQEGSVEKMSTCQKESADSWDVDSSGEVWGWVDNEPEHNVEGHKISKDGTGEPSPQPLQMLVNSLKERLKGLETEKKSALSQVQVLQDEISKLKSSGAHPTPPSVNDAEADQSSIVLTEVAIAADSNWSEGDDGWGWNSSSAKLEEQHLQLRHQQLEEGKSKDSIEDLHSKISILETEKDDLCTKNMKLTEDLKASQLRAAKLVKKAKEFKQKYDDIAERKQSLDSPIDSLDQAIEEERAKQMQSLEKELKDLRVELNSIRLERDKLLKQVEVFSSANERMLEAKERQDIEVEMWQKRSKDLTNQVQALEWKINELEEEKGKQDPLDITKQSPEKTPEKTTHSVEALNPVEVEQLLKENHTWNANYETLMQEYQKLRAQCLADSEQRTQVDAVLVQQKGIMERLEHEKKYLQDVYDSLKMDYEAANAQLALRQDTDKLVDQLSQEKADLEVELNTTQLKLEEVELQLRDTLTENVSLQDQCTHLENTKRDLINRLDQDEQNLSQQVDELTMKNADLLEQHRLLENELFTLRNISDSSARLESEVVQLRQQISELKQNTSEPQVQDVFVMREASNSTSSPSSVLNWNAMVADNTPGVSVDNVFDSIVNNNTQALEEQLNAKDTELQREKRMIETLKRTHEEAEQEWCQIIEHHKSQLEASKGLVEELKEQLAFKCSELSAQYELVQQSQGQEEKENLQTHSLQGEIIALKEHLATSQSVAHKLEEELKNKDHEIMKLQEQVQILEMKASWQLEKSLSEGSSAPTAPEAAPAAEAASSDESKVKSELDQALYMLHQRDVRCDELTLELMRLLEERDTLQLRLSNAIRMNEELREKLKQINSGNLDTSVTAQSSPSSASSTISLDDQYVPTTRVPNNQFLPEATSNQLGLASKLAELHSVGYGKDKWLREDSELRHQQQMSLLTSPSQPTILVPTPPSASNVDLPTTTSYIPLPLSDGVQNDSITDTDDINQSTSSDSQGLLNWIWGRR